MAENAINAKGDKQLHEKGDPKGPIAWMTKNSVAANLLMLAIMVAGVIGIFTVKQEVFPEFELGMVTIQVAYPGASPEETEQGIVLAVEEAVRGLDGVKRVTSTASEGMGSVNVELLLDANGDKVLADVKAAVDRITSFPEDAEKPTVSLISTRSRVISLILSGNRDLRELHDVAERVRANLLRDSHITQVEIDGVPPLEISIEISQQTLETYGLTLDEVARVVRSASIEIPGGSVKTKGGEVLVRVSDRRLKGYEFENIILRSTKDGAEVRLGQIATIHDAYRETDTASFFNGKPAVRVTAYRIGEETPHQVSKAARAYADKLKTSLPEGISISIWRDDSELLTGRVNLLVENAAYGLILVFILLAAFLHMRLALWVSLGIPVSFLGAFFLMPSFDASINMVSLFAFIVTLGMVVDDAIVVGENIFDKIESGMPKLRAAIEGTREMVVPITFSILTTMAAFAPLLFVPGVMGKIFKIMPIIVITVLGFSLVESFFILPAHLSHTKAKRSGTSRFFLARIQHRIAQGLEFFIHRIYKRGLRIAIKVRYVVVAFAIASLMVGVGMVLGGVVPFNFFPKLEGDMVSVTARLPYGTPVEQTEQVQRILEKSADQTIDENGGVQILKGMYSMLGQGPERRGPRATGGAAGGSHLVTIELNLVSSDLRDIGTEKLAAKWQENTPPIPGLESLVFKSSTGPGAGAPVDVLLSHSNKDVLKKASDELTSTLGRFTDLTDIENGFVEGKTQLDFHLLPQGRVLGLSSTDIARQLRGAFFGVEAIREQRGRNELRVMVRFPKANRTSEFDLETLLVRTPKGGQVPLKYVAKFERDKSPTSITREEGRRTVNVTAQLAYGVRSPTDVLRSLRTEVLPKLLSKYDGLSYEMGGAQREQRESLQALALYFAIAVLVMYALIAIPFKSYAQPLIIMSAIPFGFLGALMGHLLLGYNVSIISMFGIVALAGVVVNDSLVLIDATNKARANGKTAFDSILWAASRRFRPIMLTSLTTFFGLMPMITESSLQARFIIPMALSLGFGVLFSTVIILVLVPALYICLEDAKWLWTFLRGLIRSKLLYVWKYLGNVGDTI